ncbi:MAG: dihydrolipoyllysine-residue acetyltransferase [Gammaproteobacteria bacterium]|nr:dihydrolipoyllysine-residue acetyltransferase [Gammaproteobacteria bacterium]MCH9763279.1 dihydrolipoyllysine-residue acetyltransferase [Gammaproteobacteria bacterium]
MRNVREIRVPDIGGASGVDVIEVLVKPGDSVIADTPLVTLETDKASMEIPSPLEGVVQSMQLNIGDKVAEGDIILLLSVSEEKTAAALAPEVILPEDKMTEEQTALPADLPLEATSTHSGADAMIDVSIAPASAGAILAGPGVRRLARDLGVILDEVRGSGKKDRITKEDLEQFVKQKLQEKSSGSSSGLSLPEAKVIDFSKFGAIETKALNKIKRLTGENLHRAWLTIPHVTQFDESDITDLEAFRKSELKAAEKAGYKPTMLAFVSKVVARALDVFPQFNASLDASGHNLIYKKYCNIGIAVETPNGLVVPVIKNANQLSVSDISKEMVRLSKKAREKGLMPGDMQGGSFTISSLGGIGGTAFTPVVNSPEVAILGVSRSVMKPVYDGTGFVPRLMLPLSLSYDHRVIDGAEAARFTRFVGEGLSDMRRILL